jgi:hypothetical protein
VPGDAPDREARILLPPTAHGCRRPPTTPHSEQRPRHHGHRCQNGRTAPRNTREQSPRRVHEPCGSRRLDLDVPLEWNSGHGDVQTKRCNARECDFCFNGVRRAQAPFLDTIAGAKSKELLVRDEDVEVLHGFDTAEQANAYLKSQLFTSDVVGALKPLLDAVSDVRIYKAA